METRASPTPLSLHSHLEVTAEAPGEYLGGIDLWVPYSPLFEGYLAAVLVS